MMGGQMWVESAGIIGGNPPTDFKLPIDLHTDEIDSNQPLKNSSSLGSTFYFTIVAYSNQSCSLIKLDTTELNLAGQRVLIVDDNATNRQIVTLQTQSWGMLSINAASGKEALDWLSQEEPCDIAILDMYMPEMDGLSLATKIHSLPGRQTLPLIMLTSLEKQDIHQEVLQLEFAAFLNKPIKQSQLYNTLNEIFVKKHNRVQRNIYQSASLKSSLATIAKSMLAERLPLRILVAEDNNVNQQVVLYLLERLGYRADVVGNGLEVLEALQRQPYDVVLMDVQMPIMDGFEATKRIQQEWLPISRPRIIALTANAMQGDKEECLKAGMDDYISKPIRLEHLVQALSKCHSKLDSKELTDSLLLSTPIDAKTLQSFAKNLGKNAAKMLAQLINCYLAESPILMQAMQTAVTNGEPTQLQRAAHTLKASSATLGATHLANLCKEMEYMGRNQDLTEASSKLLSIETEYERVKVALQMESQQV
jgi:CheY-like chemotaxis protein